MLSLWGLASLHVMEKWMGRKKTMIVAIKGDLEAWKLFRDGRDNKWCRPPFMPGRLERDGKARWHGFSCEKCFMASPMAIWQQEQASPQAEWCPQRAYGCTSPKVQNFLSCNVSGHLTKMQRVIFYTLVVVGWIGVDDCAVCTFCKNTSVQCSQSFYVPASVNVWVKRLETFFCLLYLN